ncbi:MAG: hypothetical protein GX164_03815 [Clostridiales bacterium]|jgi:lysophospholipase L1-like esterase|nr:hypothetical protein [Clostridiales bacterium]
METKIRVKPCDIQLVSYPEKADGWQDGVYIPRKPTRTSADAILPGGFFKSNITKSDINDSKFSSDLPLLVFDPAMPLPNRCFCETEETGYGVFYYIEGVEFTFECNRQDVDITAVLRANNTHNIKNGDKGAPLRIHVNADGFDATPTPGGVPLEHGTDTAVRFTVCATGDTLSLIFYIKSDNDGNSGDPANDIPHDQQTAPQLSLVSLDIKPAAVKTPGKIQTVFIASDSTAQTYDEYYYPQTGWGEVLYSFFRSSDSVHVFTPEGSPYPHCRRYEMPDVAIENRAIGGRSSLSFFLEGKFDALLSRARSGDFVLIQFGHNDATKARPNRYAPPHVFSEYMEKYALACKSRGITPVFITPVSRRNCDGGDFSISFPEYRSAALALGEKLGIPTLDLGTASLDIYRASGVEGSKKLFLWTEPGEYTGAYKNGVSDNTHLSRKGATLFAAALAKLICESSDKRLSKIAELIDIGKVTSTLSDIPC